MTPIDKKSTTGPNIIDHKVELPTIKACPTVFQLPECTLSQIGNPISQRTEMTAPNLLPPDHSAFLLTNNNNKHHYNNCSGNK
jgi:hypothetical protein